MPPLVLASASPARLRLLHAAGLDPLVIVSGIHEDGIEAADTRSLVAALATAKAETVAGRSDLPDGALVIGCDSLLEFDGQPHGKPADRRSAIERWRIIRGREGFLHTGHHLLDTATGQAAKRVATTTIGFGRPSDEEIAAYVDTGEPLDVAGGFTLDGRGAVFIERIDGDASNVIGLSLPVLRDLLGELGRSIVDLWSP